MSERQMLSVVIPAYNEEDNVDRVYDRLSKVLDSPEADIDWEIIFAMDPCSDRTEEKILEVRARDERVKALIFSRRFGQPAATIAGIEASKGDAVIVIDCDLQDPPELIPSMIERWRFGFDVVYAQRRTRAGETLPKRIVAATGYKVIKRVADIDIPPNTGDFRLMSRRVVDHVIALNESHGFLRGLVAVVGFPQTAIPYDRDARAAGDSKYNQFFGSLVIGMNGIVSFSRYPLHLISVAGVVLSAFAFVLAFLYALAKIVGVEFPIGNATIVVLVSGFSGVQLFSLGMMGEYIGRIYDEVKQRPKFIVQTAHGVVLEHPPAPHHFAGLPEAAHRGAPDAPDHAAAAGGTLATPEEAASFEGLPDAPHAQPAGAPDA